MSTSEKKRIRVLSALSGLMSVQQRDKDSQIWPITTDIGWQYLKFRFINIFAPFSSNCKVSPIKRCFYWFSQEGKRLHNMICDVIIQFNFVAYYATKLNCIITTCRVNQSVYNDRIKEKYKRFCTTSQISVMWFVRSKNATQK